jgi:hypothetical protein
MIKAFSAALPEYFGLAIDRDRISMPSITISPYACPHAVLMASG